MVSSNGDSTSNTLLEEPLTVPTDIDIMELFSNGLRQTPKNVGLNVGKNHRYMSGRMRDLKDRGYLREVMTDGEGGRMTIITDLGHVVAAQIERYRRSHHVTFDRVCRKILEHSETTSEPYTIVIDSSSGLYSCLEQCVVYDGLVIASVLADSIEADSHQAIKENGADDLLYELFLYGLVEREDDIPVYKVTEKGREVFSTERKQIEVSVP